MHESVTLIIAFWIGGPTLDDCSSFSKDPFSTKETEATDRRTGSRPPPRPAAPIVDSALLRFLSEQKKKKQAEMELAVDQDGELETWKDTEDSTKDSTTSWLDQYNRYRVSRKLMSLGADADSATTAGEIVQKHVLSRTAGRRVREFLKKRDESWVNGESEESLEMLSALTSAAKPAAAQYGFDDVVDLMLELGLRGRDIAAVIAHTPSVALMMPRRVSGDDEEDESELESLGDGETLEETIKRSYHGLLLGTLKLRGYDARRVIRSCPGLLTMRGSKSALQIVKLYSSLGISTKVLAREKTKLPTVLSRSPSSLFRLIGFLCSDAIRMPIKNVGPLLKKDVSTELLNAVAPAPRVVQLGNITLDGSKEWSQSSSQRRDEVNDVFRRMSVTAWTLRHKVGCAQLGKIVSVCPSVLLLDAKSTILPNAAYLMNELGIWEDDLPRVLQLYPQLLALDIADMKRVVSFLLALGVNEDDLPRMFRAFPVILTYDIQKDMIPVVRFLQSIGITNVGRFVT